MKAGTDRRHQPFRSVAVGRVSAAIFTCEHASNRLPFPTPRGPDWQKVLESHWGWDIGAWSLTHELASRLRCTALGGRWSRLLVDLNRPASDPTLVPETAGAVALPWNRRLSPARIERRLMTYHMPYHVELDRLILKRLVRGVRPLLFAVHTFTPEWEGERRSFDAGILFKDHPALARRLGRGLRDEGLRVRYNQPYSGLAGMMYSVDRHGTHHGIPCVEFEFNQALFDRPSSVARLARAAARAIRRSGTRSRRYPN